MFPKLQPEPQPLQRQHRFWVKSPGIINPFDYELYFAERLFDGGRGVTTRLIYPLPPEFKEIDNPDSAAADFPPILRVSEKSMQSLMDALWLKGFRPSEKLTKPILQS